MTTPDATTQVTIRIPMHLWPEVVAMSAALGVKPARFLRMIVEQHIHRTIELREGHQRPSRRKKNRAEDV